MQLIIVAVNCHIGALLASAPLKPGVPPGGEASWAMGEQWKRTGETEGKRRWMRRFTGRGSSSHSAQSVCVEKASGFDQIFLCFFLTFRRLRTMANCTYASQPVACTVCCAPPHPTTTSQPWRSSFWRKGDGATNKMDTVRRDQRAGSRVYKSDQSGQTAALRYRFTGPV